MWGWDRKICPSPSPFVITWQASWCQTVILRRIFLSHLTLMIDSYCLGKPRDAKQWSSGWIFLSYPHTYDGFLLSGPRDAKWWSSEQIFLSHPHTYDGFLLSLQASWCQTVMLGTYFSIPPSRSWWILITSYLLNLSFLSLISSASLWVNRSAILKFKINASIATKVVCFSRLLKCLRSLYGKQCGPRTDCSYRSSLFWVHTVCFYTEFVSNVRQLFATDDFSRRHF